MKKTLNILIFIFLPIIIYTQSLAPSVISSSGDYFQSTNYSLSWTLGEIMTETFFNGSNVLTQGFQQPFGVRIKLDIKVFLEGPFAGSDMQTKLNNEELIPLNQPYNIALWNYPGSESVLAIPNNDVVDWILVELRNATDAASATPSTIISQQAG